jgi:hypothetical protein
MSVRHLHTVAAALGAATLLANVMLTGSAAAETPDSDRDDQYSQMFKFEQAVYSLNGTTDVRFTQLLGVNNKGIIAGYHGDENTENTPNKGYCTSAALSLAARRRKRSERQHHQSLGWSHPAQAHTEWGCCRSCRGRRGRSRPFRFLPRGRRR